MKEYLYGEIIPNERVGKFQLGWSKEVLLQNIGTKFTLKKLETITLIKIPSMYFFVDNDTNVVHQIRLHNDYKGKFLNLIGIGTILFDIKDKIQYELELDKDNYYTEEYIFPQYPGISVGGQENGFEDLPIEYINVYKKGLQG